MAARKRKTQNLMVRVEVTSIEREDDHWIVSARTEDDEAFKLDDKFGSWRMLVGENVFEVGRALLDYVLDQVKIRERELGLNGGTRVRRRAAG